MNYRITRSDDYLAHHGVLGMKWGVRRYQNSDGTLTAKGEKKYQNKDGSLNGGGKKLISEEYKKSMVRLLEAPEDLFLKSWNSAADDMNSNIDKFNADSEKKYGKDYGLNKNYEKDYNKLWSETYKRYEKTNLRELYSDNNKDYERAKNLVKKYEMTKWDDLAKRNSKVIDDVYKD